MTTAQRTDLSILPAARFLRSVRLDHDLHRAETLQGYVITPQVRTVLRRILTALRVEGARALTLTGPYGTGKSAFALFLARLVREPAGEAWTLLSKADGVLAAEARQVLSRPILPIALTLRRARLSVALLEGIEQQAQGIAGAEGLAAEVAEALSSDHDELDSRTVLRYVATLKEHAVQAGFGGILIVFDEMGKGLEYEARYGSDDIYLLQELAEVAARSGQYPLLFVGVLHQGFEQYGEHLLASARKEWGKVQGRFGDIEFLEPPEQQMRLAAQALGVLSPPPSKTVRAQAQTAAQALTELGQAPKKIAALEFVSLAAEAAPIHPTALMALPYVFRRFAQNERSLFAYLLSGEPHAVPQQWQSRQELIRLPDLFDYFTVNLLSSLSRQASARRWIEVVDAVEREPNLPPLDVEILKAVGLLSVLSDMGALNATYELICTALRDAPENSEVRASLDRLQEKSLIVFRRYNHTYRVWEGSDIDIEERLEEGRRTVGASLALSEILERHLPRRPMVARRHSFDTGTLRYFEVHYADAPPPSAALKTDSGGEGVLLCALPTNAEQADVFAQWAQEPEVAGRPELLVVIPQQLHTLREAAVEVRALHWIRETTPELRDDRVARREVAERLAHLEAVLMSAVDQLIDPRPAPTGSEAAYWYGGEALDIQTPRLAVQLLSDILDEVYADSPCVLNELVNRRTLSSAAAAGRGKLMSLMLSAAAEPLLGLDPEAFPPERSMYESVLREAQLHVPVNPDEEEGAWHFADPPGGHHTNLAPVWQALASAIFDAQEPFNVGKLFAKLAAPPYGVTEGLQPVLLLAFMQAHPHEISFYREGSFIPDPGMADFEVLARRPELFAVMGSRVSGGRADVLHRMAKGYKTEPALVPVVRALIRGVRSLPETSWRTKGLPENVLRLRETFNQARSPEQLLFTDIPAALGLPPISDEPTPPEQVEAFFKALNAANTTWAKHAPHQILQARATLLAALGFPATNAGWQTLIEQATLLQDRPLPTSLIPLVKRLSVAGEPDLVLDGVLALVAGRSPRSWTDADAERFPTQAHALAQAYTIAARQLGYASPEVERGSEDYAGQIRGVLNLSRATLSAQDKDAMRLALLKLLQELDD
ncbi:hypothetical protein [Deinococcus koreensis]|uniref:ATP-binding protein n=1 Tax=Deinococcus koreensis TaxID=2054903 RepID=A0A2K3UWC6_9DEIO|nr:hypothetical protein [Deinococcus koreensis]PNY80836.1 hypothetical protein CVO96_05135 [Deinococcus koreensis]